MKQGHFDHSDMLVCWVSSDESYAFSAAPEYGEEAIMRAVDDAYRKYECDTSVILWEKGSPEAETHAKEFARRIHAHNEKHNPIAISTGYQQALLDSKSFFVLFNIADNPPQWLIDSAGIIASIKDAKAEDFTMLKFSDNDESWSAEGFVDSFALRRQLSEIKTVLTAPEEYHLPQCVLLTGETGVGKSRLAKILAEKALPGRPYKHINCASLPEQLADTILFGSVKGAYTGAEDKKGYVEIVEDGILFLDELGALPFETQAHLLTLLDRKSYHRFGPPGDEKTEYKVRCKFIFGTNQNLESEVKQGKFRADLLSRINACQITIPPFRERIQTSAGRLFLETLIKTLAAEHGHLVLTQRAKDLLLRYALSYDWPGNIREFKNFFQQLAINAIRSESKNVVPALHMRYALDDHMRRMGSDVHKKLVSNIRGTDLLEDTKKAHPKYRHAEIEMIFAIASESVSCADAGKAFFQDSKKIVNYSDAFSKHIKQLGLKWSRKSISHLAPIAASTQP